MKTTLSLILLVALLALTGCDDNPINTDIECSGVYQLVSADNTELPEQLDGWYIRLSQHHSGYYNVEWLESREGRPLTFPNSNEVWMDVAMGFGDDLLAVGSLDGPAVMVFRVGDDILSGWVAMYEESQVWAINALGENPGAPPPPPTLGELEQDGVFTVSGWNPPPDDDTKYEGLFRLEAYGKVIANQQEITTAAPGEQQQDPFYGVGLLAEDYLVLFTSPFLAVYSGGGKSWSGRWVMTGNADMAKEELSLR